MNEYRIPDVWKGVSDITIAHVPDFGYEGVGANGVFENNR